MDRPALAVGFVVLIVLATAIPLGHTASRALIPRQRWRYWAHRAGLLRSPACAVEGVPFGTARTRRRRLARTAHHTQESPMDHIPSSIAVASLRTHRLILTVDAGGAAETRSNLSRPATAAVLRNIANTFATQDSDARICLEGLFTGHPCEQHASATEQDPTTADDPTALRWGLDDVLHGDDDTITVYLSGPDRAPYALELDPDRAQALRSALAPPDGRPTPSEVAVARLLAWCDCLDRGAQYWHGNPEHPYAAAIRSLIPQADAPVTGQPTARPGIDHLTSDELDRLHADLAYLQQLTAEQGQALSRAEAVREEQRTRAEQAEAKLARVRDWCDDLDASIRLHDLDQDAEHPQAVALRAILAQGDL
ncbi:hypothetical protein ACFU8I_39450 [Streptomyces sp. NPDC057540]|uniref:hypothetical protein n=1 Tax=Streptomyces sp. NPDC057540 TaxID=3346160 RepID=UPI003693208A